ncbi:Uncharacterized protein APZ42_015071 [Daphnia magna]|uniref:Uncharacterized protein n=1 Tax=Daphnia magna TaxID=35525 RepID=A0A162P5P7_9CRUS|nr:Uncharacterized protein APZ42_015071 [Daphnia magna]
MQRIRRKDGRNHALRKKKKKNHTRHHAKKNKTKTYFACSKTNGQTNGTKTHTTILYVKTLSFSAFTSGEGDESIIRQSSFILTRTQTRNHKTKNKNNDKMLMVSVDDGGRVVKLLQRPANDSNWTDQRPLPTSQEDTITRSFI